MSGGAKVISKAEFAQLSPFLRGWTVYMAGERDDQPYVPNEANPYPPLSHEASEWKRGQEKAYIEVLDSEE
jgi:hypothetical protein